MRASFITLSALWRLLAHESWLACKKEFQLLYGGGGVGGLYLKFHAASLSE
jgi:hypothetical protein